MPRPTDNLTDTRHFYRDLPSFQEFEEFTDDVHFRQAPSDWYVIITDVRGSTKAIEAGAYKDVNTIGAASISVLQEALKEDFPYVFGGDGATMLVHPSQIHDALQELLGLRSLSIQRFGLELRVGRIQICELEDSGAKIEVARHELHAGKCLAMFRGGGLTEAETRIKGQPEKYCLDQESHALPELKGLSCRWNPLPSRRGVMAALLVVALSSSPADTYKRFVSQLENFLGGSLESVNPVNTDLMKYDSLADTIRQETRFHARPGGWSWWKRMIEIFACILVFKKGWHPLVFDPVKYKHSMRVHADHRKFDDMLRLIIDCTHEQAQGIRQMLHAAHQNGEICFGMHESPTALMTCYVQDVKDGQHVHFIDGGDGGYAMAAKELKAQLKAL